MKAIWGQLPESVRGELHKAATDLQTAQADFETFKQYAERLKSEGQSFETVVAHYDGLENLLRQDPMAGFDQIAQNLGVPFQAVAAQALGVTQQDMQVIQGLKNGQLQLAGIDPQQNPQQNPQQGQPNQGQVPSYDPRDQQIAKLTQTVEQLVSNHQNSQHQAKVDTLTAEIDRFKATAPRFDELAPVMTQLANSGLVKTIEEAYEWACAKVPAPQLETPPVVPPATPQQQPAPHIEKAALSPFGTPAAGATPATRAPAGSIRESVDRHFSALGF